MQEEERVVQTALSRALCGLKIISSLEEIQQMNQTYIVLFCP